MSGPVVSQLSNEAVSCKMPPRVRQVCPAGLGLPVAVAQAHWTSMTYGNGTLPKPGIESSAR
jgi:hypothetical protein